MRGIRLHKTVAESISEESLSPPYEVNESVGFALQNWMEENKKIFPITAQNIKEKFQVENGLITNNGSFFGYPLWVPFIFAVSEEYCNGYVTMEEQFIELFPELSQFKMVYISMSDDWKIHLETFDEAQLNAEMDRIDGERL